MPGEAEKARDIQTGQLRRPHKAGRFMPVEIRRGFYACFILRGRGW